jgi:hypothetical protein
MEGGMQILNSYSKELYPVLLPYKGRQKYMHSFDLSNPKMSEGFEDYLEIVKGLCAAAGVIQGTAHMTVDEKIVRAGMSQRRPKPHVDGCFIPSIGDWGHGGGGGWLHGCNNISIDVPKRMAVIVAANEIGCKVWEGLFKGDPKNDGDLSHIVGQLGEGKVLTPGVGYYLSPDCVHESMILDKDTQRTFLRIALP